MSGLVHAAFDYGTPDRYHANSLALTELRPPFDELTVYQSLRISFMSNSEPVYSFGRSPTPASPDLSAINEVLGRYMCLESVHTHDASDMRLLELRHHLLEKMRKTPESFTDIEALLGEVNDLIAESIYTREDRETIERECLEHWKKTLVPSYTELCVETVRLKLRDTLSVGTLVDLRFALEQGIKNKTLWEDFLVDMVGPAITTSDISPDQMRCALRLIREEYESVLRIATL